MLAINKPEYDTLDMNIAGLESAYIKLENEKLITGMDWGHINE